MSSKPMQLQLLLTGRPHCWSMGTDQNLARGPGLGVAAWGTGWRVCSSTQCGDDQLLTPRSFMGEVTGIACAAVQLHTVMARFMNRI